MVVVGIKVGDETEISHLLTQSLLVEPVSRIRKT